MAFIMDYYYDNEDLDQLVQKATKVRDAKNAVQDRYLGISCDAWKRRDSEVLVVRFDIEEAYEENLPYAVEEYIKLAGTPDFVKNEYDMMDKILEQYGKKCKRKTSGCMVGKHVVDK